MAVAVINMYTMISFWEKNACELSFTPGWECKMVWLLWKTV